jgi:hypothetical protein
VTSGTPMPPENGAPRRHGVGTLLGLGVGAAALIGIGGAILGGDDDQTAQGPPASKDQPTRSAQQPPAAIGLGMIVKPADPTLTKLARDYMTTPGMPDAGPIQRWMDARPAFADCQLRDVSLGGELVLTIVGGEAIAPADRAARRTAILARLRADPAVARAEADGLATPGTAAALTTKAAKAPTRATFAANHQHPRPTAL